MSDPVSVGNVEVLEQAARALRGSDKKYRRELFRALNSVAKPLRQKVIDSIGQYMPSGYAPALSKSYSQRTQVKTGRDPAVRLLGTTRGKVKRRTRRLESGKLSHPVFGNREVWVAQDVKPGFFSEPIAGEADQVRAEMEKAIVAVHEQIVREIG